MGCVIMQRVCIQVHEGYSQLGQRNEHQTLAEFCQSGPNYPRYKEILYVVVGVLWKETEISVIMLMEEPDIYIIMCHAAQ